jgi:hypothetical protein
MMLQMIPCPENLLTKEDSWEKKKRTWKGCEVFTAVFMNSSIFSEIKSCVVR